MPGILATLNFAKNLLWPFDANAPVRYKFDNFGYISPADGRIVAPQEQVYIDGYNEERRALNEHERDIVEIGRAHV